MLTTTPILDEPKDLARKAEPEPPERTEEERRAWYQEALDGLEHYERTGLHLTGEEVDAWLDTWGNEELTEPPECHI